MTAGIATIPVRSPTLAPATHTNTYIVGDGELTVFDPASPWEDEQRALADGLRERIARGESIARIVLTHHHADHVGGAEALRREFSSDERRIPVVAHPETARRVADRIAVDAEWTAGQTLDCGGFPLTAHHTPGHAPGHLIFHHAESGSVIAGDMVAGVGTILIDPTDGDLGDYLQSLDRIAGLAPQVLFPAHGPPLPHATQVLHFYIAHRHQRTEQIRSALDRMGAATALELAPQVYPELGPEVWAVAAAQITSHLRWMRRVGLADAIRGERWTTVR